jgi:uncharacterized protein (DUF697 family)
MGSEWMEPDWDEMDSKANAVIMRYALVSGAWNILPPPLDMMGVVGTFAKMATELAGVYQVIVSSTRARQMGWAIATSTASVLGVAGVTARLVRFIPGGGILASLLVQAPIVGAVSWAAGDALKHYFKQTRMGNEPGIGALRDTFARTLHIRLKRSPDGKADAPGAGSNGASQTPAAPPAAGDAIEKIAGLHELLRAGAITQEEFDTTKAALLKKM